MKKSKFTGAAALALSSVLLISGCGVNPGEVLATLDGANITLGTPNFMAQTRAAIMEQYYGTSIWGQDVGDGVTMEQQVKDALLDEVKELYVIEKHAGDYGVSLTQEELDAANTAAANFIDQNSGSALSKMGASEPVVAEYFRLAKLQVKVQNVIQEGADTNVSDDEANQKTFSYILVPSGYTPSEEEDSVVSVDAEGAAEDTEDASADIAMGFALMASAGTSLEDIVAENDDFSVATGHYGKSDLTEEGNSTSFDLEVLNTLETMKEGEVSADAVKTDNGYYVLRMDSLLDEDATAQKKESVISERKNNLYRETVDGLIENSDWVLNEETWAKVKLDTPYTVVTAKTSEG